MQSYSLEARLCRLGTTLDWHSSHFVGPAPLLTPGSCALTFSRAEPSRSSCGGIFVEDSQAAVVLSYGSRSDQAAHLHLVDPCCSSGVSGLSDRAPSEEKEAKPEAGRVAAHLTPAELEQRRRVIARLLEGPSPTVPSYASVCVTPKRLCQDHGCN